MSRVLILSAAVASDAPPDACIDDVIGEVFTCLREELGYDVAHAAVATIGDVERAVRLARPTVVFNLCESLGGQSRGEAVVPMVLERLGVPYTGSPGGTLRTCLEKFDCNDALRRAGVPVPYSRRVTSALELVAIPLPAIVKPDREDGSVGIDAASIVHDLAAARARVDVVVREMQQPVVVQEYIAGREISVSFLGYPAPRPLSPGEIWFDRSVAGSPPILTYASKWHPESVDFLATKPVPAAIEPTSVRHVLATARRAFLALGLRDYGRVDLRIGPRGPRVIDVNPNCDLGHEGAYMRAARRSGLARAETLSLLLRGAFTRAAHVARSLS